MVYHVAGRLSWRMLSTRFWALLALYLGHCGWRWLSLPRFRWVQYYLDDLLCLPLVLTASLFLMRLFYGRQLRLSLYQVAFTVLYFTLAFELFLPRFMPRYTGDILDGLHYVVGGVIFYRFLNR